MMHADRKIRQLMAERRSLFNHYRPHESNQISHGPPLTRSSSTNPVFHPSVSGLSLSENPEDRGCG